jgi:hypothetical protein
MDMTSINLLFTVLCIWFAVMQHKTQACLYFGQAISSDDYLKINPRGLQDALTDPAGNKWFFICVASIIGALCFYFYISWIFFLIATFNIFLVAGVIKAILPKPSSQKYLLSIMSSLARRHANYQKSGDYTRSAVIVDLIDKLSLLVVK